MSPNLHHEIQMMRESFLRRRRYTGERITTYYWERDEATLAHIDFFFDLKNIFRVIYASEYYNIDRIVVCKIGFDQSNGFHKIMLEQIKSCSDNPLLITLVLD